MRKIIVIDKMQKGYVYYLTENVAENFHPEFHPELSPKEMLELGVFGGKYMTDCTNEFPIDWFEKAKLSHTIKNIKLNFYKVDSFIWSTFSV